MIAYLDRIGFLKPRTTIIHGVWVTDADLDVIAKSGTTVQHNPNSNLKLGSGLMPMREMLDRGIKVSLGTDGCGSIESVDMLRNLSNSALLRTSATSTTAAGSLPQRRSLPQRLARRQPLVARTLGRSLPVWKADIALYDRHGTAFTPLNNVMRQLVFAETGRGLRHLLVDGAVVMRDGRLSAVDEPALMDKIHTAAEALEERIRDAESTVERIRVPYERIYAKCCAQPVPSGILPVKVG